ncbi:MAG: DUF5615 family PIN-like protein [Planctomycetia bacterium]|nr:DUF5615 family PIN-like protein [Planctomycetia bacterium]
MKLTDCSFLTDQNVHQDVTDWLRAQNLSVTTAEQTGLSQSIDEAVLQYAFNHQLVVITHDADFGSLAVKNGQDHAGIIYLRPGHILPHFTISSLKTLFDSNIELHVPFIVVVKHADTIQIRVRQTNPE